MKIKHILIAFLMLLSCSCFKMIEVLGATSRIYPLVKLNKTIPDAKFDYLKTKEYRNRTTIKNYLALYDSRIAFCDDHCYHMFDFTCFIIFNCKTHIRNVLLIFIVPLAFIAITGMCCGRGVWTVPCWFRYLTSFLGIYIFIWAFKQCVKGGSDEN